MKMFLYTFTLFFLVKTHATILEKTALNKTTITIEKSDDAQFAPSTVLADWLCVIHTGDTSLRSVSYQTGSRKVKNYIWKRPIDADGNYATSLNDMVDILPKEIGIIGSQIKRTVMTKIICE